MLRAGKSRKNSVFAKNSFAFFKGSCKLNGSQRFVLKMREKQCRTVDLRRIRRYQTKLASGGTGKNTEAGVQRISSPAACRSLICNEK